MAGVATAQTPNLSRTDTAPIEERDVDEEVLRLRSEMLKMKMDYEWKLHKMEERLQAIEERDSREASRPYLRTASMTPEEKTKMEDELKALMGEKAQTTVPPTPAYPSVPERAYPGGVLQRLRPGIFQTYNPDISAIGDFTGQFFHPGKGRGEYSWGDNRYGGKREFADRFTLRELELGLQAAIDPYARADFFVGIHEGEIELEEGFMTLLTLPKGLQAKIGQFKPAIGKVSRTHRPETLQVDYPLIIRNLFGEEGARDPGVSVSWLVPNPWDKFIELTGEVLTTRDTDERYYVTHLKNFFDLTPNSSLEVGLTGLTGDLKTRFEDGKSDVHANMAGLDLTYRWKPVTYKLKPYRSFLWQSEAYFTQVDDIDVQREDPPAINDKEDSWGAFTFGEYQLTRRNYVGLRLDYAQALHNNTDFEWAITPYWTFWQSDFARWRLQYTHTRRRLDSVDPSPGSDDAIMLQTTFSIGVHRPHPF
ncbi:MAG: hypothetical protein ACK4WF_03220 [Candidatus Brocadiales bacterium]